MAGIDSPSPATATRCLQFIRTHAPNLDPQKLRLLHFTSTQSRSQKYASPRVSAVLFPEDTWPVAKQYWQHSGDGVSSRRAEYCHELMKEGILVLKKENSEEEKEDLGKFCKGPRRYRKHGSTDLTSTGGVNGIKADDSTQFVEERFGRNLELQFAETAKSAIKRRIAGSLTADVPLEDALGVAQDEVRKRDVAGFSEDDIYLYPCGMNAIFHAHLGTLSARGEMKSVMFG